MLALLAATCPSLIESPRSLHPPSRHSGRHPPVPRRRLQQLPQATTSILVEDETVALVDWKAVGDDPTRGRVTAQSALSKIPIELAMPCIRIQSCTIDRQAAAFGKSKIQEWPLFQFSGLGALTGRGCGVEWVREFCVFGVVNVKNFFGLRLGPARPSASRPARPGWGPEML